MVKELITIGSLLVGGVGLGVVAYMNSNPYAFLRPVPMPASVTEPMRVEAPIVVEQAEAVVTEEGATPTTRPQPSQVSRASRVVRTPAEAESSPVCNWREVGVKYVNDGVPTGERRVRDLCE